MKKRTAILAIAGLMLLSVGSFAQQPPAKPEKPVPAKPAPGPQGQQGPMARLQSYLNLTPEQIQKFKDFQKARQDEQKSFRDQMQKLRGDLRPMLKDEKADKGKINGLIDQIAKLGADRAKQTLGNRGGIEKILTPEQADKLKQAGPAIRQRLMNAVRGQGMAPGGPRGGRMMQPGMRGQGMGQGMRGQGMAPGRMGRGQGMRPGMGMGRGQMMRPGMGQGMMERFPVLQRLMRMRRMGARFGAWW